MAHGCVGGIVLWLVPCVCVFVAICGGCGTTGFPVALGLCPACVLALDKRTVGCTRLLYEGFVIVLPVWHEPFHHVPVKANPSVLWDAGSGVRVFSPFGGAVHHPDAAVVRVMLEFVCCSMYLPIPVFCAAYCIAYCIGEAAVPKRVKEIHCLAEWAGQDSPQ